MNSLSSDHDALQPLAREIARETLEVWQTRVRRGQVAALEPHRKSFSVLDRVGVRPDGRSVKEHLIDLLTSDNGKVRKAAVETLGVIGNSDQRIIEAILNRLGDERRQVRKGAVLALGEIEASDPAVVDALIEVIKNDEEGLSRLACWVLGHLGGVSPTVAQELLDRVDGTIPQVTNMPAGACLRKLSASNPAVANVLIEHLDDEDWMVRQHATVALGQVGSTDKKVVEALVDRLDDEQMYVRDRAAEALGKIGSAKPAVLEGLVELLGDNESDPVTSPSRTATKALGRISCPEPMVVEALLQQLEDQEEDRWTRRIAVEALGNVGGSNPEVRDNVREALLPRLEDHDDGVREAATEALGGLGSPDPAILKGLLDRLKNDKEPSVREKAASVLGKMGTPTPALQDAVREELWTRLEGDRERVRLAAAESLLGIDGSDQPVVEVLLTWLNSEDFSGRGSVVETLGEISNPDSKVIEALIGRLAADEDSSVQRAAAEVLSELGVSDPAVVEALVDRLEYENELVCRRTTEALWKLGSTKPPVVKELVRCLLDKGSYLHPVAVEVIVALPWYVFSRDRMSGYMRARGGGVRKNKKTTGLSGSRPGTISLPPGRISPVFQADSFCRQFKSISALTWLHDVDHTHDGRQVVLGSPPDCP